MTETQIDRAHIEMAARPEDDAARLRFYEVFADAELLVLLAGEPDGDQIEPQEIEVNGVSYVRVFDTEERLSDGAGGLAAYAALPGRGLARMLSDVGMGVALNLDVAPSAMLIPPEALVWLVDTLDHAPSETEDSLVEIAAPRGLPQSIIQALARKLSRATGLAEAAWLVSATYSNGGKGHVLAFVGAEPRNEGALAHAAGEALTFSGIEAGRLDVVFVGNDHPMAERLERVGLRFDLPKPEAPSVETVTAPGSDPAKPPKLR